MSCSFIFGGWQEGYLIQQTSVTNEWPRFRAATDIGYLGTGAAAGNFWLPLTNKPDIPFPFYSARHAGFNRNSTRYSTDFYTGQISGQAIVLEMPVNSYNLSLFMWLLMHNGAVETTPVSGVNQAKFTPYTDSDPEVYCTLIKVDVERETLQYDDFKSPTALGCVCSSISISGGTGDILIMSVSLVPAFSTYHNVIGLMQRGQNYRLNRYPVDYVKDMKLWMSDGDNLKGTEIDGAVSVATNSNFHSPYNPNEMPDNTWEYSESTGDMNFSDNIPSTYGSESTESFVFFDQEGGVYNQDSYSALTSFNMSQSFIKFEDLTFQTNELTRSGAGSTYSEMDVVDFEITINNHLRSYGNLSGVVQKFILGTLDITGSLSISLQSAPYAFDGSEKSPSPAINASRRIPRGLRIFSGSTYDSTDKDLITFNFPINVSNMTRDIKDIEIVDSMAFDAVQSSEYSDYYIRCTYDNALLDRGIT